MPDSYRLIKIPLAVMAIAITACSPLLQPAPQPYPPQPVETATPASAAGWNTILGDTSAPDGWHVEACDNPILLCVQKEGQLIGTVELLTLDVRGSEFEQMMREAGIEPAIAATNSQQALQTWIRTHYAVIQQDREAAGENFRFVAQPPTAQPIGELSGLRYGFSTVRPDGNLFDRTVGYVASDGNKLYVIVAALTPGDPSGTFASDVDLREFEPHLDRIVTGLNLPAR